MSKLLRYHSSPLIAAGAWPLRGVAGALVVGALLLGGCSLLGKKQAATIYAPDARVQADPAWPSVKWQLSLSRPTAASTLDSLRIAVRPAPGELQVYKGAGWAKTPTDQVMDTVLRALEDSGRIPAVARQGSGIAADYKLVMDLRRFEADYAGAAVPAATVELNIKLLHAPDHDVVDSRTFLQAVPATGADVAAVSQAFEQALGRIGHDVAGWTLTTGEAHERSDAQHKSSKR
ncbi:MAG: ABC-type transport auxiliary lipoprotein family protein [Lysobacter sp.]|nr:ABC-type transport auxiliary lipoprotein family protein [Lysobacter sp.]